MSHTQPTFDNAEERAISICVINQSLGEITLYLEPWGEEYRLPAQESYLIKGYGREAGSGFEVAYQERAIVVTAWKGSTVRLYFRNQEVGNCAQRPMVPDFM